MDIEAYISSGILEQYCLGLLGEEDRAGVEQYAQQYPAVKEELGRIGATIEEYAMSNALKPADRIKTRLLLRTYEMDSGAGKPYPPMVQDETGVADFIQWMEGRSFPTPNVDYDNLFTSDLPSTAAVMSALVWAKKGLEEEVHTQYNEFVVILDGHCDMFMNGQKTHYEKGDIIRIPPHVPHHAVITSAQPMMAIVQRQLIAA